MTTPKVVKCPDGHYCRAIFGLGPYIADYPEQVWLAAIVSGWCPTYVYHTLLFFFLTSCRCDTFPEDLDAPNAHHRRHEIADLLINSFDSDVIWTDYGV
jgi:hypothetical protein